MTQRKKKSDAKSGKKKVAIRDIETKDATKTKGGALCTNENITFRAIKPSGITADDDWEARK